MTEVESKKHYIREWRKARGMVLQDIADGIGRDVSVVSKIERFETNLTQANLTSIARFLNVTPGALFFPPPDGTRPLRDDEALQIGNIAVPKSAAEADSVNIPHLEVPVYKTKAGPNVAMLLAFEAVEDIPRPGPLFGVRDAFAVYVVGRDMAPTYKPGDLILLHPGKPSDIGDDVLILFGQEGDQYQAVIREIIDGTTNSFVGKAHGNGSTETYTLAELDGMYRIVGRFHGS